MPIGEVMLAPQGWKPEQAVFPYLATPKIDGIRFYVEHRDVWTRSGKPLPNLCLRRELPKFLPDGVDGELFHSCFGDTQSQVMTELSIPQVGIYVFDHVGIQSIPYIDRVRSLQGVVKAMGWHRDVSLPLPQYRTSRTDLQGNYYVSPLYPVWVQNHSQMEAFYQRSVDQGFEGIILRSPSSPYHEGRCTVSQNYIQKWKQSEDREARVIAVEELLVNQNVQTRNELGRAKRSKVATGLVPGGRLGAFVVRDIQTEVQFRIGMGPGLTTLLRQQLWSDRHHLPGKIVKFRCVPYGAKDKPRHPQFLGFRDESDL